VTTDPARNAGVRIIVLVEDTVPTSGLSAEHGLSLWIEYAGKRILFDTGQSNLLIHNAKKLDINIADVDAIVLSHGHYDHTGGLAAVLAIAAQAKIYLHPAALEPKFSQKAFEVEAIGMPDSAKRALRNRHVFLTETSTQILPGVQITGQVPRITDFENVGGAFFLDKNCCKPDELLDDQTLFIESPEGLVVVFGCAHAGVVNILHYIADLAETRQVYSVLGGMHLLHASWERIERTERVFREYKLQRIGPAHCTGADASRRFWNDFPDQCFQCAVGSEIKF
jgi:7,8-dihydropterin-6-yl-methyl-4-(beta-D-ribofuranosyl)aminobenzene 5'-phosphate synthase